MLLLERFAPRDGTYHHNNFAIRTVNMTPEEVPNGHAHCQGLLLCRDLKHRGWGNPVRRWQRIFCIELDHAQPRLLSVLVMGQTVEETLV